MGPGIDDIGLYVAQIIVGVETFLAFNLMLPLPLCMPAASSFPTLLSCVSCSMFAVNAAAQGLHCASPNASLMTRGAAFRR